MYTKTLIKAFVCLFVATTLADKAWANSTEATITRDFSTESVTIPIASQYFNPVDPSAPTSPSTTTGTRTGGCFNSDASPSLMAPVNFVGATATHLPTFTWSLPNDEPVPLEFNLYAIHTSGSLTLQHTQNVAYESGITQYQLPAEAVIDTDQSYLWQVILHCNPNRPSQSLVYEAEVELVLAGEATLPRDTAQRSVTEQSRVFAEAGYWYDAIAVLGTSEASDVAQMRALLLSDLALIEETMAAVSAVSMEE